MLINPIMTNTPLIIAEKRVFKNSDEIFLQPKMHGLNAKAIQVFSCA
jgi:hypothetical protein